MNDRMPAQTDEPKDDATKDRPAPNPAAGPHAKAELTNDAATPGTGALPEHEGEGDADGGVG
ncbi:hypothetical protein GCM10011390_06740 [Aureimonas endophytica]|uniref:Uncharacterized protein n=1 Tax=Aureimonas endophytica TaxID=2027858 RepID=A0A916ZDY5_9HYPH|nr:hypothetical protein [Aureimonas endophytica]GGD90632.1 hypothetical protein GCM10011390_06740 [Aureimonas endophytica]